MCRLGHFIRLILREYICATHANNAVTPIGTAKAKESSTFGLDKEKVLKVSWYRIGGEDYSAQRLRELFRGSGEIEDEVIRSCT